MRAVQLFLDDEQAARTKYVDQVIEVSGPVMEVNKTDGKITGVKISSDEFYIVNCSFQEPVESLSQSEITIKGVCSGFLGDSESMLPGGTLELKTFRHRSTYKLKTYLIMRTLILFSIVCIITTGLRAQDKYFTRDGLVTFFSSTPVEDIEAENKKMTVVLDAASGKMEFSVLMKSFEFEKALMEEHFNEKLCRIEHLPKGHFQGTDR